MKSMPLTGPLPDSVLRLMDPAIRASLGKHYRTWDEIQQKALMDTERKLHHDIENLLRLKNVCYFHSRTDRKTTRPKGEPDFLLSVLMQKLTKSDPTNVVPVTVAIALEVKLPGKKLSPEQEEMFRRMTAFPNGWMCRVVHSVDDVLAILKDLGV